MHTVAHRTVRFALLSIVVWTVTVLLPAPAAAQLEQKLDELEAALGDVYDGQPATLEECIRAARVGSVTLGRFEEDVLTAITGKRAALMQWLPDLSVNFNYQKSERTELDQQLFETVIDTLTGIGEVTPGTIGTVPIGGIDQNGNLVPVLQPMQVPTGEFADQTIDQTFQTLSASSNWTVFNGFDRWAERKQANATYDASVASLDYQRDVLREQVTNAFYDYIRAQQRVEVALEAEELAAQELERSETYFELGISTRSEVLQAKVRLQQTKLDIVRERNGERNAFLVLAHAMNIPGARPFAVDDDLPEVSAMQIPDLDGLLGTARELRLDLEAAAYNLDASEAGVTRARANYWPQVQVFAQYSRSESETPFRFGAQENTSLAYGIQGSWAIFDRWRTQQQTRNAVANRRRAEYDLRQVQLDVELEVVNLWNNLTEAIESYEVSVVSVEQSEEDLRLAEERFRVGAGTALDVITAQVNLAQARRDLVDAQINAIRFRSQLERATGESAVRTTEG